ncbi:hypothetical protein [Methylibium petroleiphilum]
MRTWAEFLPRTVLWLPGCPEIVIKDAVRDAAMDVLKRTRAWKVRAVPLGITVVGQSDYTIVPPTFAGLTHIHVAWIGTDELTVGLPGEIDDDHRAENNDPRECRIQAYDGTTVRLTPAPSVADQAITGTVSWVPLETALGIEDILYADSDLREAIECKAIGELMLQPQKPWSSDRAGTKIGRSDELVDLVANRVGPVRRNPLRVKQWG